MAIIAVNAPASLASLTVLNLVRPSILSTYKSTNPIILNFSLHCNSLICEDDYSMVYWVFVIGGWSLTETPTRLFSY